MSSVSRMLTEAISDLSMLAFTTTETRSMAAVRSSMTLATVRFASAISPVWRCVVRDEASNSSSA